MNYTREELNNAIFLVLFKQYKKEAKEAHSIVGEAGYKIEKWDGSFEVKNPKTARYLHIHWGDYSGTLNMRSGSKRFKTTEELKRVDFVGQLDTTREVYFAPDEYESEALRKYSDIKHQDSMAELYDNDIKQTLKKIASLQDDLIRYTRWKAEYEAKAKECRKEYGLI